MDIRLHYTQRGAGEPLILLHGNGESSDYFKNQLDAFAAYFRVIAVDTRGHGQSPRGTAPFTLAQFAQDLGDFMDGLDIRKAHLLGFSDGGNIALLFALRYPERVDRLILNGANLNPRGVRAAFQAPIEAAHALLGLFAGLGLPGATARREMLGLMVGQPDIRPGELRALRLPVLVLAGDRDLIREAHTRAIAAAIPGAELCILRGDHFIAAKRSAAYNARVLEFLTRPREAAGR